MNPRISYQESPQGLYKAMYAIENYLNGSGLTHTEIHLIKVRASQINGCGYCLDMHHKDALKAGETFDRLYLLPAWKESPCYTDEEKALLNLTDVLTRIADSTPEQVEQAYDRMAKYFDKEKIANTVLAICQINSWNRIAITFGNIPGSYQPK
ncbi:MAG: carboxymuconolactone decarboxylase family protein [Cyclobacteriaceae bacterium]|nr:carboxymuconolactone decarboxylase family protein [Cyclobacteriaceae bacterium SS2]